MPLFQQFSAFMTLSVRVIIKTFSMLQLDNLTVSYATLVHPLDKHSIKK